MSSWLSLFHSEDDVDDRDDPARPGNQNSLSAAVGDGGVKGDLSAFSQTLSHQLRGVAAFLAPPPNSSQVDNSQTVSSSSRTITGIKHDLAEIEETVKSTLSLLSSKFTSSLLHYKNSNNKYDRGIYEYEEEYDQDEDDDDYVAGINEEVVNFVRELSSRPEFFTDFPINLPDDFEISDIQREHAETIEHLVPGLRTLRQKICSHLSIGQFWTIYFTILLPRFSENDLKHLSTPEIVEVREALLRKLQRDRNIVVDNTDKSKAVGSTEEGFKFSKGGEQVLDKQNLSADTCGAPQEANTVNSQRPEQWLDDKDSNPSTAFHAQRLTRNEEEISFSDLEDDDKGVSDGQYGFGLGRRSTASSLGEPNEWIKLNERSAVHAADQHKIGQSGCRGKDSEGEDSNGWDHVDDADLESLVSV